MDPTSIPPAGSIFRWETLREIERDVLPFEEPVSGFKMEVELISGTRIKVFRAEDGRFYFCHGLSFGGTDAPHGAISPYSGKAVNTILAELFAQVTPETNALVGDILVWYDFDGVSIHSAILVQPIVSPAGDRLDYSSTLRSKNGKRPEAKTALGELVDGKRSYGESYRVYRRRPVKE